MTWTKMAIKAKLEEDDAWLCRGLIAIYKKQTTEEQTNERTKVHNKVGFNRIDAPFLTSLAKSFINFNSLTPKQLKWCRKKMLKYSSQLARIANHEI